MPTVEFIVEERDGGFVARSSCGCIVTQAGTLEELRTNVREAAACHAEECTQPDAIKLRFVKVVREETIAP
jgi:predicted RNase H-like HicB family nuclease